MVTSNKDAWSLKSTLIQWYEYRIAQLLFQRLGATTSSLVGPVGVGDSLARVGLATGAETASSTALCNDGTFGVAVMSSKMLVVASTSITSTACSRALSSRFLITETAFFKALVSWISFSQWIAGADPWILQASVFWLNLPLLLDGPVFFWWWLWWKTTLNDSPRKPFGSGLNQFGCCFCSRGVYLFASLWRLFLTLNLLPIFLLVSGMAPQF